MSTETIGIIGVVAMLALMFLRMPLGVAMAMAGTFGFISIVGLEKGISILGTTVFGTLNSNIMIVMPLFVLMGSLAAIVGLSLDAYYAVNKWLGHLPGGLAMATVGGCTGFAAVCGSAIATAATMCRVSLPEMRRYKYDDRLSLGTIACGGLLGFMIPPSIPFMIYSIFTEESIGKLFIAGILPGLLIAVLYIIAIYIICRTNPELGPAGPRASWLERIKALYKIWGILVLFILVLGGMYGGIFTPNEAGGVGAFGALVLGLVNRRLTWKGFTAALSETGQLTGMLFILIIGATIFNYFMAISKIPFSLAALISALPVPPIAVVLVLVVVYIILGFFMEIISVVMLTLPIIYPLLLAMHIDPIWFAVLTVLTIMIGQITPPVGVVVFALGGLVKDVPLYTIFRGVWPFFFAMIVALIILLLFPQISLWLPHLMRPALI